MDGGAWCATVHECVVGPDLDIGNFLIGGKLLYSVVLVSDVQQLTSAIIIHMSSPSWASLLSSHPTPLGNHRTPSWALSIIYGHWYF